MKRGRSSKTMEKLVAKRNLPEGDVATQLLTLQAIVTNKLEWARACSTNIIDKTTYFTFVGLIGAALYSFSPQGRPSGIEDMKMSQLPALLQDGFAQSSVFKTNAKYGFQPVTMSTTTIELIQIYCNHIRPAANGTNAIKGKYITSYYVN
jgi:hypothetical protein